MFFYLAGPFAYGHIHIWVAETLITIVVIGSLLVPLSEPHRYHTTFDIPRHGGGKVWKKALPGRKIGGDLHCSSVYLQT